MNTEIPDIRAELADEFETAKKSTGPPTPEGKQRSSQNALDRRLERKIRLLMGLQQYRILCGAPARASAPRPTPARNPALSRGERVARDGAFSSRCGSGEGSLHCCPHPAQNTENSRNELNDLLQSKALTTNYPSKRTVSEAPNDLLGGVHESDGPACPIHEPTPHPSCSGWRKRRSPTPSPHGRGLFRRLGERVARNGAFTSRRGSGEGSFHCHTHPAQYTENSGNELHDLLQSRGLTQNDRSKRTGYFAQNEPVIGTNHSGNPPEGPSPAPASVAPTFRSACRAKTRRNIRRGSGEGSLHCHTHPAQQTENSRNELHDSLQSKGVTRNYPSKRTGHSAPNEPLGGANPPRYIPLSRGDRMGHDGVVSDRRRSGEGSPSENPALSLGERVARDGAVFSRRGSGVGPPTESAALSLGERVARDGAFTSRRGSGEGSLPCHTDPSQNTENSRNELKDLLQARDLAHYVHTKRTISETQNEVVGGVNEWAGPARPIREPTPHPSCSRWGRRRSPTPSPQGRGLFRRLGERVARNGAFTSRRGSGEGLLPCHTHPAQYTENSGNELNDLLQSRGLTQNDRSKRTGYFAQNEPVIGTNHSGNPPEGARPAPASVAPTFRSACRAKTPRNIRRGSGEGSLHCHTHPAQQTENSRNELHDSLQSQLLTRMPPQNELVILPQTNRWVGQTPRVIYPSPEGTG